MARSLGLAQWADGTVRFFIHCDTANHSFSRLFVTADEARDAYRAGGIEILKSPRKATDLQVVRIVLSRAWDFDGQEEHEYGLATGDSLIHSPTDDYADPCGVLELNGVLHLSKTTSGGFDGHYDYAMCDANVDYNPKASPHRLEEAYDRHKQLCPDCCAKVLGY